VPVVSIATADLRAELNCHRGEEDSCITIERQCERRHNVEGRNLKRDFDSLVTQEVPVARAVRPPTPPPPPPGMLGECMALAPHLRMVVWPCKFQPHLLEKYDRIVNSIEFL
jgi:hypothetical protein